MDNNLLILFISSIVSFVLGLFSSLIIDNLRNFIKRRSYKRFILSYLDTILEFLILLKDEYISLKKNIEDYSFENHTINAFEGFNVNVFNSISSSEYFEIFGKNFKLYNEIISIIDFLSTQLPWNLDKEYKDHLNNHLKEINKIGDIKHIYECEDCKNKRIRALKILDFRIEEVNKLNLKINEFRNLYI